MQKLQDGLMYDEKRERIVLVGREMGKAINPLRRSCHGNTKVFRGRKDDASNNSKRGKKKTKDHHTRSSKRGAGKGKVVAGGIEADGK